MEPTEWLLEVLYYGKTVKMSVIPESQIRLDGIKILKEKLGVVNTIKFLEQFDNGGSGDYTKEKYETPDVAHSKEEILKMFQ